MSVGLSRTAIALISALSTSPALSQTKPSPWFPVPADAIFETGDTWTAGGKRYRLYGVQSCLRGTSFTNAKGVKRDCGEASLAMLVSLVRDLRPMCYAAVYIIGSNGPNTGTLRAARNSSAAFFCSAVYCSGAIVGRRCCDNAGPAKSRTPANNAQDAAKRNMSYLFL